MRAHESSVTGKYQGEKHELSNHPNKLLILI